MAEGAGSDDGQAAKKAVGGLLYSAQKEGGRGHSLRPRYARGPELEAAPSLARGVMSLTHHVSPPFFPSPISSDVAWADAVDHIGLVHYQVLLEATGHRQRWNLVLEPEHRAWTPGAGPLPWSAARGMTGVCPPVRRSSNPVKNFPTRSFGTS